MAKKGKHEPVELTPSAKRKLDQAKKMGAARGAKASEQKKRQKKRRSALDIAKRATSGRPGKARKQ